MLKLAIAACAVLGLAVPARAHDLIALKSPKPVGATLDRLQELVTADGFLIIGRVPHSEAAKGAGLTLRPTELLIFGKPQSGTPVMVCDQRAGYDLPLRALAWQDEAGQVWLGMNDPQFLKRAYALPAACDSVLAAMETNVRRFLAAATTP